MNNDLKHPRHILDSGLGAMRNRAADSGQVEEAASRVLRNLAAEHAKVVAHPASAEAQGIERIRSCDDFRSLIPAYLSSSLTASRNLLFEDHVHECVLCRKALEQARRNFRTEEKYREAGFFPRPEIHLAKWVAAVAVAAGMVLALQTAMVRDFLRPIDVHAMAQTVEGSLYSVDGQQVRPISAGQRIERSQVVRTGNSSIAVLELADGSRIEMNARSELALDHARDGVRINVNRGNIIVTAAKQHGGHLYAATKELGISVVGTVFEVNAGMKGSRVTVIQGEVQVQQGQTVQPLRPGEQLSTDPGMAAVPVQQEISWSRDLGKYLALLNLSQDIAARVGAIELRHTSDLVRLVPESTVIFASLPNISQPIADSYVLVKQRFAENPLLADWWQRNARAPGGGLLNTDRIVERLTQAGAYLGGEIVFAFPQNTNAEAPVLLADTASQDQLAAALADSGARIARSVTEVQAFTASSGSVFYVGQGLMIASGDANQVLRSLRFRSDPPANSFTSTALYQRVAQAYTEGVGWLFAADLQRLVGNSDAKFQLTTGIGDMQQFVAEQKTGSGGASYRAILGFSQNRRGMAAWLAPPSPMGALEFISPNAYGVAGVVTKDPSLMLDDLFALLPGDSQALKDFENYQTDHRVDIRRDLVAPLGNELLIAVDGPILPMPSWRIVIEVNDAARLQNTIEWSIANMNREAAAQQQHGATLTSETAAGRTFYSLTGTNSPTEIHYTYWAGYMIIAPNRAMLMDAIQNHDTGNSLPRSAAFRSQLPADGQDYASGFVYQNIQAMTKSLPVDVLKQIPVNTVPSLVCLYGEADRIVMSSKGVLGMNVASLAGITGMLKLTGLKGVK
jgi:hypothetical protein